MRVGERVTTTKQISLLPHTTVEPGETGTVDSIDPDTGEVWVKLDKYHHGLGEWYNCIWLNEYTDEVAKALVWLKVTQAA